MRPATDSAAPDNKAVIAIGTLDSVTIIWLRLSAADCPNIARSDSATGKLTAPYMLDIMNRAARSNTKSMNMSWRCLTSSLHFAKISQLIF